MTKDFDRQNSPFGPLTVMLLVYILLVVMAVIACVGCSNQYPVEYKYTIYDIPNRITCPLCKKYSYLNTIDNEPVKGFFFVTYRCYNKHGTGCLFDSEKGLHAPLYCKDFSK